jgi:IclR family KDG regulon transcriptional repressor
VSIVAVQRALIILKHLALSREGISVRDLARTLAYSPAVVQKSMQALVSQNFAQQDPKTHRYHLGPAALQVGFAGLTRMGLRDAARPYLRHLVDYSGETAMLGIRYGNEVIYIDKVSSSHDVRVDPPIGAGRPFNCTAVGKAILAYMPTETVEELSSRQAFAQHTPHSVTDLQALRLELAEIRERGVAVDREEFLEGAMCFGAPVKDHEGNVVAAIAVSGPVQRMKEREAGISNEIKVCAQKISAEIGNTEGLLISQWAAESRLSEIIPEETGREAPAKGQSDV